MRLLAFLGLLALALADSNTNSTTETVPTTTAPKKTTTGATPKPPAAPVANTTNGLIRGRVLSQKVVGSVVLSFENIPYAKPPVGQLRFAKPVKAVPWPSNVTLDGTRHGAACLQGGLKPSDVAEDCLNLNVYTPDLPKGPKAKAYPVMVWIHGGSFNSGSGWFYFAESVGRNFVSRGVVVVTLNYRLGAFGFTDGKNSLPANLGLYDQWLALEWVREQISAFGGDPDQVIVFGESAGAASLSLLNLSPKVSASSLYQRSIQQSGSAFDPWALDDGAPRGYAANATRDFVLGTACATEEQWAKGKARGLLACLRKLNATALLNASVHANMNRWSPVVDGPDGLVPHNASTLALGRSANVTSIMGTNRDEAGGEFLRALADKHSGLTLANFTAATFLRHVALTAPSGLFGAQTAAVRAALRFAYARDVPRGNETKEGHLAWINAIVDMVSDFEFKAGAVREARELVRRNGTVWAYSFDYVSASFPWPQGYKAVVHAMDLLYVFPGLAKVEGLEWNETAADLAVSESFGRMWTDFAIHGDPNGAKGDLWQPFGQRAEYLRIDSPSVHMDGYNKQAEEVWNDLVPVIASSGGGPFPHPPAEQGGVAYGYLVGTWLLLSLLVLAVLAILFFMVKYRNEYDNL